MRGFSRCYHCGTRGKKFDNVVISFHANNQLVNALHLAVKSIIVHDMFCLIFFIFVCEMTEMTRIINLRCIRIRMVIHVASMKTLVAILNLGSIGDMSLSSPIRTGCGEDIVELVAVWCGLTSVAC